MNERVIPWCLGILTAAWFGWQASRAGRSRLGWCIGGGVFGLITTTIIFGLGEASVNPFSDAQRLTLRYEWAGLSALLILVFGWLFTMPLHRHHLALWKRVNPRSAAPTATPTEPATASRSEPKTPAPKPATTRA